VRARRLSLLLFCFIASAYSQLVSFGVKGGIPLSDPLNTSSGGSGGVTHGVRRYVIGVTGELHLPFGFSVEVDALYRRVGFDTFGTSFGSILPGLPANSRSTGSDWQFPFLAKYSFRGPVIHPFIDAGVTLRRLDFSNVNLSDPNSAGFTLGGGIELRLLIVRLSPEIRYTHFGTDAFGPNFNFVRSSSNQTDFLVGLTF
jgi:opacity protein-like surface antigen